MHEFSEYSVSGIPQKGTDRASMLGTSVDPKPSGGRFKHSPLLKDVLLKDEPKVQVPKKLKPIGVHLRQTLQERKEQAKERLKESEKKLPKFKEMLRRSLNAQKSPSGYDGGRSNSLIKVKRNNRYEDDSTRGSNLDLPKY